MKTQENPQKSFLDRLGGSFFADSAFDRIPDTVFFVKDTAGRYVAVNRTLVERCGMKSKQSLIGKTAAEVFPQRLGQRYAAQDEAVLRRDARVEGVLELHLYPSGREGWCITWKEPVLDASGKVAGLAGISRDIAPAHRSSDDVSKLARVQAYVREHAGHRLLVPELAKLAGLSAYQLNRRMIAVFGLSAKDLITRERIDRACALLKSGGLPISQIALDCGYSDQAAFTRHFRQTVGVTPSAYSALTRSSHRA